MEEERQPDEERLQGVLSDLESHLSPTPSTVDPFPLPAVLGLRRFLSSAQPNSLFLFFRALTSGKSFPLSSFVESLAVTMQSTSPTLSLSCSTLFVDLIVAPGSPILSIFTPVCFLSMMQSIRRSIRCGGSPESGNARKRKGKKARPLRPHGDEGGDPEGNFDRRLIYDVLGELVRVVRLVHLERFPDCLKCLISVVAEIPANVNDFGFCGSDGAYREMTELCGKILREVLRFENGGAEKESVAAEVLKSLSGSILGRHEAKAFALGFLRESVVELGRHSGGVKQAILNLPKYLAQKVPEKSELRAEGVESIMEVVKMLDDHEHVEFFDYVLRMSQGKNNLRILAVDLITAVFMNFRDLLRIGLEEGGEITWGVKFLRALIQRCSDSGALIRARALSNLAQLVGILSENERNHVELKEALGIGDGGGEAPEGGINDVLRKRCLDEKALVRRAAINLANKLTTLLRGSFDGVVLKTIGMACSDPLVSIRKAAVLALSEAFRRSPNESIVTEWLHSVPRSIADNESSIQEECENLFMELVLERIMGKGSSVIPPKQDTSGKSKKNEFDQQLDQLLPEGVLSLLKQICDGEVAPWVKRICRNLGKKNLLRPRIVLALQDIIRTSETLWLSFSGPIEKWIAPEGAWLLLSEVSVYLHKAVDWEFLHHHWKLLDRGGIKGTSSSPFTCQGLFEENNAANSGSTAPAGDCVYLLQTIANVSLELSPEAAADMAQNLLRRIEEFNLLPTEVNAHIKALARICRRKALSTEEGDILMLKWIKQVMAKACKYLKSYLSQNPDGNREGTFFTPTREGGGGPETTKSLSQAITSAYTIGSLVIVYPSADTSAVVPLVHSIITSGKSDLKSKKLPGPTDSMKQVVAPLYIHGWLTMGKICLADSKLAKRYIPLFIQELERSDSAALRNNLMVTMADFCVHYTALVDCYISKLTKCLRDPCELVRRQTFVLLSRLLQRDYVKWKGVLFLRFLLALVDESSKIRELADFLFGNILKVKSPLLAYNSFVEAIFVLNDCTAHGGRTGSLCSLDERRLFSIRGSDEASRSKRMHIYGSLLKQMAPEHRLATFAKVCAEILAGATDGMLNIGDSASQSVLQDAFQILICKQMHIPTNRGSSDSTDPEEGGGDPNSASASPPAGGKAITQAVRKSLIQNTIPIFIELKRLLESKNSPLTGSLMECLRLLLKDYKNEIDDMLVADKQLQKELVYDMQKYEAARARTEAGRSPQRARNYEEGSTSAAAADTAAEEMARSVLRQVNRDLSTPSLRTLSVPKVRRTPNGGSGSQRDMPKEVLESLRRSQPLIPDEDN
ncbi:hypothetical protein MLD38_020533 [Melastoma candidum]|uniref:Uncharacterized protein n=1 Tax=Melastoma candidum TaxID=119954 RepID=A0ACB9QDH2_9MYRT|nr:hypothetical protein MLD38_020533 [Melastoma candidum]